MLKRNLLPILLIFLSMYSSLSAQIEEVLIDKAIEKIEEAVNDDEKELSDDDEYDATYRTSEEENENGTRYDFNHLNDCLLYTSPSPRDS